MLSTIISENRKKTKNVQTEIVFIQSNIFYAGTFAFEFFVSTFQIQMTHHTFLLPILYILFFDKFL